MTKQQAVETIRAEANRLWEDSRQTPNPITRTACEFMAQKLQWAISIFQQVETKED